MVSQGSLFDVDLPDEPACWVYLIGVPGKSIAKIGKAQDTAKRLASLQTSHHERLSVLWRTPGGRDLEKRLHAFFGRKRLEGEWFDFGDEEPAEAVRRALELPPGPPSESRREIPWVSYTRYPAPDDPDRDDIAFQPNDEGCRWLTPTERVASGLAADDEPVFWCLCHGHWRHY
jgi:hypothetical protein